MKVAVSTEDGRVAQHFGRCPEYTLAELRDGKIVEKEVIPNPGHKPGYLPGYLAERGVDCIIAGGMGPRAKELFEVRNIETIDGVTGDVDTILADYGNDRLEGGKGFCEH